MSSQQSRSPRGATRSGALVDVAAERITLAACFAPGWLDEIREILPSPSMFGQETSASLYRAMLSLLDAGRTIDALTLTAACERLAAEERGAAYWTHERVAMLAGETYPELLAYGEHARRVRDMWQRRELDAFGRQAQLDARDVATGEQDVLDRAETRLFAIRESIAGDDREPEPTTLLDETRRQLDDARRQHAEQPTRPVGIPTGIFDYDYATGGLLVPSFTIIGARTSIGKTALLFTWANAAMRNGDAPVIFSYEEKPRPLLLRLACMRARVPSRSAAAGTLSDDERERLEHAFEAIAQEPHRIIRASGMSHLELRSRARKWRRRIGARFIGIDYLQRMPVPPGREDFRIRIGWVTRSLFDLSEDLDVAVVLGSQLNRNADSRPTKKPELSDMKESGNIEEDADTVILIHRPEFYGDAYFDVDMEHPAAGRARLIVAKNRHGKTIPLGVECAYLGEFRLFDDRPVDLDPPRVLEATWP